MLNAEAQKNEKRCACARCSLPRDLYLIYTHKEIRMWCDVMSIVYYTCNPKINRETRMKISLHRWVTERWHISRNFNLNSSFPTSLSHFIRWIFVVVVVLRMRLDERKWFWLVLALDSGVRVMRRLRVSEWARTVYARWNVQNYLHIARNAHRRFKYIKKTKFERLQFIKFAIE